jgi:hypothetical protein
MRPAPNPETFQVRSQEAALYLISLASEERASDGGTRLVPTFPLVCAIIDEANRPIFVFRNPHRSRESAQEDFRRGKRAIGKARIEALERLRSAEAQARYYGGVPEVQKMN